MIAPAPDQAPLAARRQPVADPAPAVARRDRAVRAHADPRRPRQVRRHPHPVVADDGQHRRRARDPVGDDGRGRDGARADLLGRAARAVDGRDAVRAAPALSLPAGLGHAGRRSACSWGRSSTCASCFLVTHQDADSRVHPADLADHELGARRRQLRLPRLLQPPDRELDPEPRHGRARSSTTCTPRSVGAHERAAGEGTGAAARRRGDPRDAADRRDDAVREERLPAAPRPSRARRRGRRAPARR